MGFLDAFKAVGEGEGPHPIGPLDVCWSSNGHMVRDARRCRAPHHEGPRPRSREKVQYLILKTSSARPHPEEARRAVSKDEATARENAPVPVIDAPRRIRL